MRSVVSFLPAAGRAIVCLAPILAYGQYTCGTPGIAITPFINGVTGTFPNITFTGMKRVADYAERIIDHFRMSAYFEGVFGSELDGTRCDKAELLAYALEVTGVDPLQAAMIAWKGIRTEGPMAPEIDMSQQRPAQYVFDSNVQLTLSQIRTNEAREKQKKAANAA